MTRDNRPGAGGLERRVLLGHVAGAHGIRGAVLVRSYTAEPGAIADYGVLEDETGKPLFALTVEGGTAKGLICRVEGVGDRTAAETLKGVALYVPRDRLPPPDANVAYAFAIARGEVFYVPSVIDGVISIPLSSVGRSSRSRASDGRKPARCADSATPHRSSCASIATYAVLTENAVARMTLVCPLARPSELPGPYGSLV